MSDNSTPRKTVIAFDTSPTSCGVITLAAEDYHLLKSEIDHLRAELERAERVRDGIKLANSKNIAAYNDLVDLYVIALAERDEARADLEMTEKENALWRGHVQKGSEVIAELYSRLEKEERRIEQLMEAGRQQEVEIGGLVRAGTTVMIERDEARELAKRYYALWRMAESALKGGE